MKNMPAITQEKLERLMACLVAEFEKKHPAQTSKLGEYSFYLTERMGCAKAAGLNYEVPAIKNPEKEPVMLRRSEYSAAVTELISRGLLEASKNNPLIFHITPHGLSETKRLNSIKSRSKLGQALEFCKENKEAIKLASTIIGLAGAAIGAIVKYT
jgi:hypothetical protein